MQPATEAPSTIEFLGLSPPEQRLQIRDEVHCLAQEFNSHIKDPAAHKPGNSRIEAEVRDKGPTVAILAALLVLIEVLGYG